MPVCFVPAGVVYQDLEEKGKVVSFTNTAEHGLLGKNVWNNNWEQEENEKNRELEIEINNGRLLRGKEHLPETES